jgi:zeaxanthin glucosyltransferase
MAHFGIVSPPVSGHLHPFAALGRELIARGHRATCLHMPDLEAQIRSLGIGYVPVGSSDHPRGSLPESLERLARLRGLAALRFTIRAVERTSEMLLRDGPQAIQEAGIDALLVDQMEPAGGAIAEHLGLPFITVCNALPINRDVRLPPPFIGWAYGESGWAHLRNRIGYAASDWMLRPIRRVVARYRAEWGLPALGSPDESFSKLAQISQLPREFDFPRTEVPAGFHYVGPLRHATQGFGPDLTPFPWERLDGRPLVYASLGTLQNRREALFRCFAEACHGLDVQLVISHGGGLNPRQAASLPGGPLVVGYAPQTQLLAGARLTITHAGLNTVLDSLASAVPMVAVPIAYEQAAIAQRVAWIGAGKFLPLAKIDAARLRETVREVLREARYRQAAGRLADAIRAAGGVRKAADIVESACLD